MRVNTTRIEVTVMALALLLLIALAIAPAFWGNAIGQESRTSTEENAANTNETIAAGQQYSIEGIVIRRADREFTVRANDRREILVVVTGKTEIKTVRKDLFRRDKATTASEIVRGLRLSVEGTGNADGKLIARIVRFDEQQSLEGIASQTGSEQRTAVVNLTNWP